MTDDLSLSRQSPDQSPSVRSGILLTRLYFHLLPVVPGRGLVHQVDELFYKLVDEFVLLGTVGVKSHAVIKQDVCLPLIIIRIHHAQVLPRHVPPVVVGVYTEERLQHLQLFLLRLVPHGCTCVDPAYSVACLDAAPGFTVCLRSCEILVSEALLLLSPSFLLLLAVVNVLRGDGLVSVLPPVHHQ